MHCRTSGVVEGLETFQESNKEAPTESQRRVYPGLIYHVISFKEVVRDARAVAITCCLPSISIACVMKSKAHWLAHMPNFGGFACGSCAVLLIIIDDQSQSVPDLLGEVVDLTFETSKGRPCFAPPPPQKKGWSDLHYS